MSSREDSKRRGPGPLRRRDFLRAGSGLAATVGLAGCAPAPAPQTGPPAEKQPAAEPAAGQQGQQQDRPRVTAYRILGRTGFKASDIGIGCGGISEPNVVRYAYDHGVNLFDTAEGYGNGASERAIGGAMQHLDRKKVFIITKLKVEPADTEQKLLDRFAASLGRLKTTYADALYMHSVTDLKLLQHAGFHAAVKRLKADGKLRHAGVSSHGPRDKAGDSMDQVLLGAVQDGRFDVMLLVYSFMNAGPGEKVLAACKEKNVGATLMKVAPRALEPMTFDPDNPGPKFQRYIKLMMGRGKTREEAIAYIQKRLARKRKKFLAHKPAIDAFIAKHGIKTQEQLSKASVLWALQNPAVGSVCVSMNEFEAIDRFVPLSGSKLSAAGAGLLEDYRAALGSGYCRHGCTACAGVCPSGVPVSTVLRYASYFRHQGREKLALQKYAALCGADGSWCVDCHAPCLAACPHGVQVQAQLLAAHGLLTLA